MLSQAPGKGSRQPGQEAGDCFLARLPGHLRLLVAQWRDVLGAPAHEEQNDEHRDGHPKKPEEDPASFAFLLTLPKGLELCFHIPESGVPARGMD